MDTESIDQHMGVISCPYNLILDHDSQRTKLDHVTIPNTEQNVYKVDWLLSQNESERPFQLNWTV